MLRFLSKSKTFLPIVMQKSTTDAIQILEKYPSLSTAQHEGKLEAQKEEATSEEIQNKESPNIKPLRQEIIKQISSTPEDSMKIVLHKSPSALDADRVPEASKDSVTSDESSPESLKIVAVDPERQKTLLKALMMDMVQVQRGLLVLLAAGRVWLWQRLLGGQQASGTQGVQGQDTSQPKEQEPEPLLSIVLSKDKEESKEEKQEEDSPKSNVWEVIQENSPGWQRSISNQLGELQRVVVDKLSK